MCGSNTTEETKGGKAPKQQLTLSMLKAYIDGAVTGRMIIRMYNGMRNIHPMKKSNVADSVSKKQFLSFLYYTMRGCVEERSFVVQHMISSEPDSLVTGRQVKEFTEDMIVSVIHLLNEEKMLMGWSLEKTGDCILGTSRLTAYLMAELKAKEFSSDKTNMERFLDNLEIPTLEPEEVENLDRALGQEEINNAIMAMQSGKSPGPDGYPIEFYKKFKDKLTPVLLEVFQESLENGSLPPSLSQAAISLLLKKDKDPTQCGSYRPISLLNVDVKILAKVLACRLEHPLPKIVSDDQTGFIKNRYFFNIRRLADVVYSLSDSPSPEVVIALDTEKAFDRVEWVYLFSVLEKFGFGRIFIAWVKLLYHSPLACIQTNYFRSGYFPLTRGTRQGCPLPPLLFAIAIEPLSIAIKSTTLFQGVRRGDMEHHVSLYADDLLLYVSDPIGSSPAIVSLLGQFGAFSGYKLNFQKSKCFPINNLALQIRLESLPFPLSQDGFVYLGIHITRSFTSLFEANYRPQVSQMKADFERWRSLPLTIAGRIQSVKMTILPRFLYLFQCLPVFLSKLFFKSVDQAITSFIWENKVPRVNKRILQRGRDVGGMGLPSFIHYYWASNIQKVLFWLHRPDIIWCLLESRSCHSSSLPALVYSSLPLKSSQFTSNPVVLSTLKIFNQSRCHYKFISASVLGPIHKNHLFPPSTFDSAFRQWGLNGLMRIKDLYTDNIFDSFDNLRGKYGLPHNHFFKYLQIRHFVKEKFPSFPVLPPAMLWEKFTLSFNNKGLISELYSQLMSLGVQDLNKTKSRWEDDLGMDLVEEYWAKVLNRVHFSSSCARLGLIQFKVLHRVHLSKARLVDIYPGTDAGCDRCSFSPAGLIHAFWSCPRLDDCWALVFKIISEVLGVTLRPCPLIAVFGVADDDLGLNASQSDIIAFTSLLAHRRILLVWKSATPPTAAAWLEDVMFFLKLEKIKFTLRGSVKKFYSKWGPFLSYFGSLKELPTS
ncbi:MTOR-associated protein MEAK7 isoform X2 [Mobula birostris]